MDNKLIYYILSTFVATPVKNSKPSQQMAWRLPRPAKGSAEAHKPPGSFPHSLKMQ